MRVCRLAIALIVATSGLAVADVAISDSINVDHRWPGLPDSRELSLEDQITDHLTELGNLVGSHIDFVSHEMIGLRVNGRANRARLRLGGGDVRYLSFRIDSDWLFGDGKARVNAHLELGLHGHTLDLRLPAMDVIPDSYHGQQLVQINVPLLERRF